MGKSFLRCAIYTRKSSEEGLDQTFNSLHAQREACDAFILSQRHEGWSAISTGYDDGGFSGGTMARPGLQALLADIRASEIDVVVVYKIDRLTRSLFDFAKMVEIFDAQNVSFVSVTQAFNTTTSMGRLTLNVLLSFAQFEREVTGERIRDKVAASKRRGMWMGGNIPLGYDVKDRKLIANEAEAETVRQIYRLYANLGAVRLVKLELDRLSLRTKVQTARSGLSNGGLPFRIGHLYTILRNPLYRGEVNHKGKRYAGEHPAIVDPTLWDQVQTALAANAINRSTGRNCKSPSLLAGRLFDGTGIRYTPSHAVKHGKRYRYYIANHLIAGSKSGRDANRQAGLRIPAPELEQHVVAAVVAFLGDAQRVVASLLPAESSPALAMDTVHRTKRLAEEIKLAVGRGDHELFRTIISRVEILRDAIKIDLDRQALLPHVEIASGAPHLEAAKPLQLSVPSELCRAGKGKRLIVPVNDSVPSRDPVLVRAVVRAHRWFGMLKNGAAASISEIARAEQLPRTYVGSIIPLAFLAPDITSAILDGTQPATLNLDCLINMQLPLDWNAQRLKLRFMSVGPPSRLGDNPGNGRQVC